MTDRLCLTCRRNAPEHLLERREEGGWWCRQPAVCVLRGDGERTTDEARAMQVRERGGYVETVGLDPTGRPIWSVSG